MYTIKADLTHFGTKGMRWGVRKKRQSTSKRKLTPAEQQKRYKKYAKIGLAVWLGYEVGKALELPLLAKIGARTGVMRVSKMAKDRASDIRAEKARRENVIKLTTGAIEYIDATFKN